MIVDITGVIITPGDKGMGCLGIGGISPLRTIV